MTLEYTGSVVQGPFSRFFELLIVSKFRFALQKWRQAWLSNPTRFDKFFHGRRRSMCFEGESDSSQAGGLVRVRGLVFSFKIRLFFRA